MCVMCVAGKIVVLIQRARGKTIQHNLFIILDYMYMENISTNCFLFCVTKDWREIWIRKILGNKEKRMRCGRILIT